MAGRLWKDRELGAPSPEEMAWMAAQAYPKPGFPGAESFTMVANGGKVKVKARECVVLDRAEDPKTGLDAYLISDKKRSFAVMAIRGTEEVAIGNSDVGADIEFGAFGQVPKQARVASDVFERWRNKYDKNGTIRWGVTGHSLGGMDVQYVVAKNGNNISWAYNFSGPNLYPVLAAHEKEGAQRFGDKLYSFGGAGDWIYQHFRDQPMVGFMGYMDFADPGNHDLGSQFRFDDDGNPVLMGGRLHDVLVEALGSGGGRVGSRAATIMLSKPVAFRVMARQAELEEHLERVREHNRRIADEMREGFHRVVERFSRVAGVCPEDIRRVVEELGLAPERNVDQGALDRVERNMRKLIEENRQWLRSLARVVEGKIAEDVKASRGVFGSQVPDWATVSRGLKGDSVSR